MSYRYDEVFPKVGTELARLGIKHEATSNRIYVNRDAMCESQFYTQGVLPEDNTEGCYALVLAHLNKFIDIHWGRLYWAGKTDDDLFLDLLTVGA